ncbi:caspase-3-like [Babylonia areolata]|uniref:caspase-3-like n=1 Tax=Babylonia areolata TaxID=304850 RepID=UPI003FD1BB3B
MDDQMDDRMDVSESSRNGAGDAVDARGSAGAGAAAGGSASVVMKASQFVSDCYKMDHKERGCAVIFNNKRFHPSTGMGERSGTDVDADQLYMLLTEIGFDVLLKNDCSTRDMESILAKVAKNDHSNADCFTCAILSHGEEGYVYGTDGRIEIDKLVAPFKGHKCQSLAGKPKIFFIQACRGTQLDSGVGVEVSDAKGTGPQEEDMDTVDVRRIPTEADFLMAYSVVPGYFAWRNSTRGSWFVQALVEVLRENWKRMDLLTMMTRVSRKVAFDFESNASKEFMNRKKQIPCITSMLTRDLFFTPKK